MRWAKGLLVGKQGIDWKMPQVMRLALGQGTGLPGVLGPLRWLRLQETRNGEADPVEVLPMALDAFPFNCKATVRDGSVQACVPLW